ncbi:MAG: hypothetical protein M3198_13535 [Actinomycetota bacterium]|nr:hypothetical protein [Actinomycetota bacterium]
MTQDFHIEDFTEEHYRFVLNEAQQTYSFEPFWTSSEEFHTLWRHDVDLSVHRAARIAAIEAELGVTATYFFLLHSEFYNLLERRVMELAHQIVELGHWVGLHFDLAFYGASVTHDVLEEALTHERKLLERLLRSPVRVFSFHNPEWGNALSLKEDVLGEMVNAYGHRISSSYRYVSDSDGYWRFHRLADVVTREKPPRLHVLTHPEWWQQTALRPRDRVKRCVEGRMHSALESYDERMRDMGRVNVGFDDDIA